MRTYRWLFATILALLAPACAAPEAPPPVQERITVLASWTGRERAQFDAMTKEFERAHGFRFRVDYQGTRALEQVLLADVQKGAPPDIAIVPSPAELQRYADAPLDQPRLVELPEAYDNEGPQPYSRFWEWVQRLGKPEQRFAVVAKADLKSIVWYQRDGAPIRPPESWDDMLALARASGGWCLGMGAPPLSGWPGTDWIEDILLEKYGPADYAEFAQGRMHWTDERVKIAWRAWGEVLAGSRAGAPAALLTDFGDAGRGMFERPQRCSLDHGASFLKTEYQAQTRPDGSSLVAGEDFDYFRVPPEGRPSIVSADLAVMFKGTAGAKAFMQFLASAEGQSILAGDRGSSVYSIDKNLRDSGLYAGRPGGVVDQRIAREISEADRLCFDASDLMPATMRSAFYRAVLEYVREPARLDEILERLEAVRGQLAGPPPAEAWASFACVAP
ncbi:ABC transporter substrate-binding protein [Saccharopolyspora hattusasensis]|uniref:ABC transporter substrate-binding protein n=1 Tax=Saccharopolyspora hattusasensis TaxID=1128679 RepID=UPI003D98E11C